MAVVSQASSHQAPVGVSAADEAELLGGTGDLAEVARASAGPVAAGRPGGDAVAAPDEVAAVAVGGQEPVDTSAHSRPGGCLDRVPDPGPQHARTPASRAARRGRRRCAAGRPAGRGRSGPGRRGEHDDPRCRGTTASSTLCVTNTHVRPVSCADRAQVLLQPLAGERVQRGERLVEQQQRVVARRAPGRWPPAAAGRRRSPRSGGRRVPASPTRPSRPSRAVGPVRPRRRRRTAARARRCRRPYFHGNSRGCWNTTPALAPGHGRLRRTTVTVPAVGRSKPAISRSSVLLPQPDAPTRPGTPPAGPSRSIGPRAVTGVAPPP